MATTPVVFDLDRPLAFYHLAYSDEGPEVTVGRTDIDSYAVLPADGASLLRRLADGEPPRQAAAWYARHFGEDVDIVDFLDTLNGLRFVRDEPSPAAAAPVGGQRLGRAMFSTPAWICYGLLLGAAVVTMTDNPALRPHYENLFFTPSATLVLLALFFGQLPLALLHEAGHVLAGRRLGLRTRLRVSNRLHFVVFETGLDGLVVMPRRRRYLPIAAGVLVDLLAFTVFTLVAAATAAPDGSPSAIGRVCLALAFGILLRVAWQFQLYLRTDVYYLVATALRCENLHAAAWALLRDRLARLSRGRPRPDADEWSARDRAMARWYVWLILVGYAVSLATLVTAVLPALGTLLAAALSRFGRAGSTPAEATDAAVFLTLTGLQLLMVAVVLTRDLRHRRRTGTAT